jgi:hypothetical protein
MKADGLRWSHGAAMRILQGEGVQSVLSPGYVLLRGQHRLPYHPEPGFDEVELAAIYWMPLLMSPAELFEKIKSS